MNMPTGFPSNIRAQLRDSVGSFCSARHCQVQTSGFDQIAAKSIHNGDAAHINGAKPTAARYDKNQSDEERHGFNNGIWLCPTCHRQVDQDENLYSEDILIEWKKWAILAHNEGYRRLYQPPAAAELHLELERVRISSTSRLPR